MIGKLMRCTVWFEREKTTSKCIWFFGLRFINQINERSFWSILGACMQHYVQPIFFAVWLQNELVTTRFYSMNLLESKVFVDELAVYVLWWIHCLQHWGWHIASGYYTSILLGKGRAPLKHGNSDDIRCFSDHLIWCYAVYLPDLFFVFPECLTSCFE